jgi:hypothetical protein
MVQRHQEEVSNPLSTLASTTPEVGEYLSAKKLWARGLVAKRAHRTNFPDSYFVNWIEPTAATNVEALDDTPKVYYVDGVMYATYSSPLNVDLRGLATGREFKMVAADGPAELSMSPGVLASLPSAMVASPLALENRLLQDRVAELESRMSFVETVLPEVKTVVLRTLSREDAKAEIYGLMNESPEPLYYSDISEALNISLPTVVEIVNELAKEGSIEPVDTVA